MLGNAYPWFWPMVGMDELGDGRLGDCIRELLVVSRHTSLICVF